MILFVLVLHISSIFAIPFDGPSSTNAVGNTWAYQGWNPSPTQPPHGQYGAARPGLLKRQSISEIVTASANTVGFINQNAHWLYTCADTAYQPIVYDGNSQWGCASSSLIGGTSTSWNNDIATQPSTCWDNSYSTACTYGCSGDGLTVCPASAGYCQVATLYCPAGTFSSLGCDTFSFDWQIYWEATYFESTPLLLATSWPILSTDTNIDPYPLTSPSPASVTVTTPVSLYTSTPVPETSPTPTSTPASTSSPTPTSSETPSPTPTTTSSPTSTVLSSSTISTPTSVTSISTIIPISTTTLSSSSSSSSSSLTSSLSTSSLTSSSSLSSSSIPTTPVSTSRSSPPISITSVTPTSSNILTITSTTSPTASSTQRSNVSHTGAIAGGAAAGAVALIAVIAVLVVVLLRRRKAVYRQSVMNGPAEMEQDSGLPQEFVHPSKNY